jgi:hydroxyacylglutathione hydrolase
MIQMNNPAPEVSRLVLGMLQTNCYMVVCPETRAALVIDPADSAEQIIAAARNKDARIQQILLTHAHMDHIAALAALRRSTQARVLVHRLEVDMVAQYLGLFGLTPDHFPPLAPDLELEGGETISIGNLTGTVIHTPGHTPGGISLTLGDAVFTGDTLFAQGIGRVDLPGGSLKILLESIQQLLTLPDDTRVYPGHGPSSSIGAERLDNPYV